MKDAIRKRLVTAEAEHTLLRLERDALRAEQDATVRAEYLEGLNDQIRKEIRSLRKAGSR